MNGLIPSILILLGFGIADLAGEEIFVTVQKVTGNRIVVVKDSSGSGGGGRGRRMNGAAGKAPAEGKGFGRGKGRRRFGAAANGGAASGGVTLVVPASAKITSAMRERRTFEFLVLAELPGGLRHRVFREMKQPLVARIVTQGNVITEMNVITGQTDINQSSSDANGNAILAVRPKRPPTKRSVGKGKNGKN